MPGGGMGDMMSGSSDLVSSTQMSPSPRGAPFFSGGFVHRNDSTEAGHTSARERDRERQQEHEGRDDHRKRVGQMPWVAHAEVGEVAAAGGRQGDDEHRGPDRPRAVLTKQGRGMKAGEPEQPPGGEPVENQSAQ